MILEIEGTRKTEQELFDFVAMKIGRLGELKKTTVKYQSFVFIRPGVKIVFYYHKSGQGHKSMRARDENSKHKHIAYAMMDILEADSGMGNTFHVNNRHKHINY